LRKEAGSLSKQIESSFGEKPKMSMAMGELKVLVNGDPVYSYKSEGHLPAEQILARIAKKRNS